MPVRFQHEEVVLPAGGVLTAVQIFIRPETGGLMPNVQFHEFPDVISLNEWRAAVGRGDDFPLQIRSGTWIYDMKLDLGKQQSLPALPIGNATCLVYVFDGSLAVNLLSASAFPNFYREEKKWINDLLTIGPFSCISQ
jgi:redox-sensitive bicupin YhaK (pirin superfamily)